MFAPYADVLKLPGAFAFSFACFIGRLPLAMTSLGVILLVSVRTSQYALAGALSATLALSEALVGPLSSRLVDRLGQARVVPVLASLHAAGLITLTVLVLVNAPVQILVITAAATGAAFANFGTLVRARWSFLLTGKPALRTAFALESVVDEVIFVTGPPLVTLVALQFADWSGLVLCAVLTVTGAIVLAPQRRTQPPPAPGNKGQQAAIRLPGLAIISASFFCLGAVFGVFEVVTVAFASEYGQTGWAAGLLALYALGSGATALVVGTLHLRTSLPVMFRVCMGLLAVTTLAFPFVGSVPVLAVVCVMAGIAVSPALIFGFALVEKLVPADRLNEGLSWSTTGLAAGFGIAAGLSGLVVDASGASHAYWLMPIAAGLALLILLVGARPLDRAVGAAHLLPDRGAEDQRSTT